MNQAPNPYAPPSEVADVDSPKLLGFESDLRREDDVIVASARGAVFPARCVVCNAPAERRLKRTLFWHPPGYYALLLVGPLIFVIASSLARQRAQFEIGVCDQHAARRRNGLLLAWLSGPVGFALVVLSPPQSLAFAIFIATVAAIVAGALMARVISAKRIDKRYAWLKVGRAFLESIPD